jgi:hypothetical protein
MSERWGAQVQWNMLEPLLLPQPKLNASNKLYEKKLWVFETKKIR